MQDYSNIANFAALLSENYSVETKVVINSVEYGEDVLQSLTTSKTAIDTERPSIGHALAGQIELSMMEPAAEIPKGAAINVYIRLFADTMKHNKSAIAGIAIAGQIKAGSAPMVRTYSGWLPKGVYYISSRELDEETGVLTIRGYDIMRKADAVYSYSTLTWSDASPNARAVLDEIASFMGITLDSRTQTAIPVNTTYIVSFPSDYTYREVLSSIAAMYGGNFCISDAGELFYVGLADIPAETYYLSTEDGDYITIGGTRILLEA